MGKLKQFCDSGVPPISRLNTLKTPPPKLKAIQEFVVEAEEQLDYVTDGYDNLVKN